jgi:hypothetical protein
MFLSNRECRATACGQYAKYLLLLVVVVSGLEYGFEQSDKISTCSCSPPAKKFDMQYNASLTHDVTRQQRYGRDLYYQSFPINPYSTTSSYVTYFEQVGVNSSQDYLMKWTVYRSQSSCCSKSSEA